MTGPILPGTKFGTAGRARSFVWPHILFRLAWNTTWLVFASWTPPQLYGWRRFLLKAFGARLAPDARIYGSARVWYPPNLVMGAGSTLGRRVNCYNMALVTLEPFTTISQYAHLVAGTHDIDDPNFQLFAKPITIGAHAWVATSAFVGPGVTIGEGAVLGACAVAFKDLEPWTVYVGNPAQPVKTRRKFT